MRVKIVGGVAAAALRQQLITEGFPVVTALPTQTVIIDERDDGSVTIPIVDGVDTEFERELVSALAELTGAVVVQRAGGIQRDDQIRIVIPAAPETQLAAQRAVYRAIHTAFPDRRSWWLRSFDMWRSRRSSALPR